MVGSEKFYHREQGEHKEEKNNYPFSLGDDFLNHKIGADDAVKFFFG